MKNIVRIFPLLFVASVMSMLSLCGASGADEEGWKEVSKSGDITIFNRSRKGSDILEVKAVGVFDVAPIVVKRVLDDSDEHPKFMPYVAESRVISRKGDTVIGYQRLSLPIISDRDYTMRIHFETRRCADGGTAYCNRWETANELGPPERAGVARVKINEGYWLMEPVPGRAQTRATYCVYCDSGGKIPSSFANTANRTAIPKLFESIRKQVKLEKYATGK